MIPPVRRSRTGSHLARIARRMREDQVLRDDLIVQMYHEGASYAEIAACAELSKAGVHWVLNRRGALGAR